MILFVDDEERYMDSYVMALKLSGQQVSFQTKVDNALVFFEENWNSIKTVILDIMLPPGKKINSEESQAGYRTGVILYNLMREKAKNLPIIIFTNVSDQDVMQMFLKEEGCRFFRKSDYLPSELVEEVKKIVGATSV
jgi:DNA-binding NtrC family response regulator